MTAGPAGKPQQDPALTAGGSLFYFARNGGIQAGGWEQPVSFDVLAARKRFSALNDEFVFLDAPGGTQTPDEVGEAVASCYREASGNLGVPYATGRSR